MRDDKLRLGRVTASTIGMVLGVSEWGGPLEAFERCMGHKVLADNVKLRFGRRIEGPIADEYAESEGVKLRQTSTRANKFLAGTPDRKVVGAPKVLEIKTAGIRQASKWGEPGTDQIPQDYLLQGTVYAHLWDVESWDLAVLIGGNDFRIYRMRRDLELEAMVLEAAEKFWRDHLQTGIPPPVDHHASSAEWLAKRYPRDTVPLLPANAAAEELARTLAAAKADLDAAEQRKALAENRLKELIGDAAGIEGAFGRLTWRAQETKRTDWRAVAAEAQAPQDLIQKHTTTTTSRVFRARFNNEENEP